LKYGICAYDKERKCTDKCVALRGENEEKRCMRGDFVISEEEEE